MQVLDRLDAEMEDLGEGLVLSASDLTNFLACPHLTALQLAVADGKLEKPHRQDPHVDVLRRRGDAHEAEHLARLKEQGLSVAEIAFDHKGGAAALRAAEADTLAAMSSGADVIFQATFYDGTWRGHADFLMKVERPSDLGPWSYEPVDTKLARKAKPAHIHQLCAYALQVERLQGVMPEQGHLVLGDRTTETIELRPVMPLHLHAKRRLEAVVSRRDDAPYPEPVAHCDICDFSLECDTRRRVDRHLSLVAGAGRSSREDLVAGGVGTIDLLAAPEQGAACEGVRPETLERLRIQAHLQVRREQGERFPIHWLQPQHVKGFAALPPPDEGDVFFEFEGDPWVTDHGIEFRWGWVERGEDGSWRYQSIWAHDPVREKAALERFLDRMLELRRRHPGMHIYHYSAAEPGAIKRLAMQHATRESDVDELLRAGVFVDLLAILKQALQAGVESYGLKAIEAGYEFKRQDSSVRGGGGAVVMYEQWLAEPDQDLLDAIELYNEDDCRSTIALRDWLLELLPQAEMALGITFDHFREPEPEEPRGEPEWLAETVALAERLLAGLPEDPVEDTGEDRQRRLMAGLLLYHRREELPDWWLHFALPLIPEEELFENPEAIVGLQPETGEWIDVRKSKAMWFTFPEQLHKIDADEKLRDTLDGDPTGRIEAIENTRLLLVRSSKLEGRPLPRTVVAGNVFDTEMLREALMEIGKDLDVTGSLPAVAASILCRESPQITGIPSGAPLQEGAITVEETVARAMALEAGTHLVIQGPPGTGKTYRGARIAVAAMDAGWTVGVCARQHLAVHNLVNEIEVAAAEAGVPFTGYYHDSRYGSSPAGHVTSKGGEARLGGDDPPDLIAGTNFLFCKGKHAGRCDLLIVDEAGQMALADAVGMSRSAPRMILLGDPQQLAHVQKGTHPEGVGESALRHLLGGHATVPETQGLLLAETRRMHPGVCRYISETFYDSRLQPVPGCELQRIDARRGDLAGAGVRWMPVQHEHRSQHCPEEAEAIAAACRDLLAGGTFVDRKGVARELDAEDILVVAPYNLSVQCIEKAVPSGVKVGTVNRFQGQEAPVVFYAMSCSTGADAPRGIEFLFELNRLNVAVSRAQALAVLVCSPRLLDAECRSVEQMAMVGAVCSMVQRTPEGRTSPEPVVNPRCPGRSRG